MHTQHIDGKSYRIRHIKQGTGEGATITLLGKTYGFTELPLSHMPTSADLVEGSYTRRLGDSGEFQLTFPNVAGSKGLWRDRFSSDYSSEFIEIYRDDVLEFVGYIDRVDIDSGTVSVSGKDAWSLLKRAYESDRHWTMAPRDIFENYTHVPFTVFADDFDTAGSWVAEADASFAYDGMSNLVVTNTTGGGAPNVHVVVPDPAALDDWTIIAQLKTYTGIDAMVQLVDSTSPSAPEYGFYVRVTGALLELAVTDTSSQQVTGIPRANMPLPITFEIRKRDQWIMAYANGKFIGILPFETMQVLDWLRLSASSTGAKSTWSSVVMRRPEPFLMRGADKGKYVLPTDLPTGGLHGRYWNDTDLQGVSSGLRKQRILAPTRSPYAERLDPVIDTSGGLSIPVQPGNSGEYFSVRWFGAVYLRLDQGDYAFEIASLDDGVRLWVGKTAWSDELLTDWNDGAPRTVSATLTASTLGSEAGWYPIVLEYYQGSGGKSIQLKFTPPAGGYTDPGGTAIAASTKIVIPSTSLSPLGCYDAHVQNQPYFDILQDVAQQMGYQIQVEPMQFESSEFPGRLVPRIRAGRDTDVVLVNETDDSGEPILNAGYTLDSSEQVVIISGQGSGQADNQGSQTTSAVYDTTGMNTALFAMEAQVSATDIDFADLLEARLNAELALRGTPWEEVRGVPRGLDRLADTWPLTETLSAMRWEPGDGVRLYLPEIGLVDQDPRQITQVTRNFAAEGRTGTTVSFRQRPRSAVRSIRSTIQSALKHTRNYQGQKMPIWGSFVLTEVVSGGGFSGYCYIPLNESDHVVKGECRIVVNNGLQSMGLEINGVNRTTSLGGPWVTPPVIIDITPYAVAASNTDSRIFIRAINNGVSNSIIEFNAFIEVIR
jgi:hypothetical protein